MATEEMQLQRMSIFRIVETTVTFDVEPADGIPQRAGIHFCKDPSVFGLSHAPNEVLQQFDVSPIAPTKRHVPRERPGLPGEPPERYNQLVMTYAIRVVWMIPGLDDDEMREQFGTAAVPTADDPEEYEAGEEVATEETSDVAP